MLSKTNSPAATHRLYLRAQRGMLTSSKGSFASISGSITGIEYREHIDKNGEHYFNWHVLIDDAAHGEYYDVAFSQLCDGFGYLLSALLTTEGLSVLSDITIDLSPYKAKGTMAIVSSGGCRIDRGERMPALETYMGEDGRQMYDNSARHAWMMSAMERINLAINRATDKK